MTLRHFISMAREGLWGPLTRLKVIIGTFLNFSVTPSGTAQWCHRAVTQETDQGRRSVLRGIPAAKAITTVL